MHYKFGILGGMGSIVTPLRQKVNIQEIITCLDKNIEDS